LGRNDDRLWRWRRAGEAITALLLTSSLAAQNYRTETQHAVEASRPLGERWQLTIHSRLRTQPGGLGLYQFRAGPILEYAITPRVSGLGGYYFSKQQRVERDVVGTHRPFGGVKWTAVKLRHYEVELRSLVERFLTERDYTRYRNRVRWSATTRWAPYANVESFADRGGVRSTRYSVGLRWSTPGKRLDWDFGYFGEPRRRDLGPPRHMFLTTIHVRLKPAAKRPDPDI
jgi:hypothetical protein